MVPSLKVLTSLWLLSICLTFEIEAHSLKPSKKLAKVPFDASECDSVKDFTPELQQEIRSKQTVVDKIIKLVINGDEKHSTYRELSNFCDDFGPRLCGSESLSDAIKFMTAKMRSSGKLNVHPEKAMIPRWEIGKQWAELVEPVRRPMNILALGGSVGTNNKTLEAEARVINSFEELDTLGKQGKINGRIVVYNYNFTNYGESVQFRQSGAVRAGAYGAAAALVRSVTPFSIYSPHTGHSARANISTAAITTEDADLIQRLANRGKKLVLRIYIEAQNFDDVESFNVIGDLTGSEKPDEIVLVSGHIDSWYNTEGAMDDGGGMMISYKAVDTLQKLNLQARRTVRAVLWTCEEFGLYGVQQYVKDHKQELDKFKIVMESDLGTFAPLGLSQINFNRLGKCVLNKVLNLTASISTNKLNDAYEGSDIETFTNLGVAGLSLYNQNDHYFYYHHTSGDSMSLENPDDLDRTTILWAAASYVLADLSIDLSRLKA